MLLENLGSSQDGVVIGTTEKGERVILPVPHPDAIVGSAVYQTRYHNRGRVDSAMAEAEEKLKKRARRDMGNYYMILPGTHKVEGRIFVIPFVTFMK